MNPTCSGFPEGMVMTIVIIEFWVLCVFLDMINRLDKNFNVCWDKIVNNQMLRYLNQE